jgi:hypothetical protein
LSLIAANMYPKYAMQVTRYLNAVFGTKRTSYLS